jgi:hypothetical protein
VVRLVVGVSSVAIQTASFVVAAVRGGAADPIDLTPSEDWEGSGVDGDPYIITKTSEFRHFNRSRFT